jgi:acylphosphatase
MRRLTAYISGRVQRSGYRGKVVAVAKAFGLKGTVQNLPDGRVLVVAEGEDADLERFANALVMKNAIINVTGIEKQYSPSAGGFEDFGKIVGQGETDERLDTAVDHLKVLIDLTKQGLGKQDQMLDKQDQMLGKMDLMLDKQDQMIGTQDQTLGKLDLMLDKQDEIVEKIDEAKTEIVTEIKDLRSDFKTNIEDRLSRIESDMAQVKAKIGL